MKIYSNIQLFGNTVTDLKAEQLLIGTTGKNSGGGIKYDITQHCLKYYDPTANDNAGAWLAIGSSTTIVHTGVFNVTNTAPTNNETPANSLEINIAGTSESAGNLNLSTTKGVLNVCNGTNRFSLNIGAGLVYFNTFDITDANTEYVTLVNPFNSPYVIVDVYQLNTYKISSGGETLTKTGYDKVICEVFVKDSTDNNSAIELRFDNITVNHRYMAVIIGTDNASETTSTKSPSSQTNNERNPAVKQNS